MDNQRNHFGFIGALVSFIENNWNFKVLHLGLKLVSWHHNGSLLSEPIVNILNMHQFQNEISFSSTSFL
ncbi:hypothetical protein VP01_972g9 [Puccinia sorghi]|uniref:Uncharacterized protein n=1 Tax=Puccinia sorghi TaxID=27349 RepID=A0A0L6U5X4_9BASI|nr:hypothetical protein VP01_972g9 [Puccinia sorghi]